MDPSRARRLDLVVFLLLFAVVLVLRGGAAHVATNIGIDGGYYFGVAQQVRLGRGLVSNLSIYNFGYPEFPYPTAVYPLWPALLGLVGRYVDMEEAAHWVPWGFYMLSGVGAWLFGRTAFPGPIWARVPGFGAGHLFALLLWTNPQYRAWSVGPYTEPLGWCLLFFGLWRFAQRRDSLSPLWGLELGVWAVVPFFARAQLMVFPMALGCALGWRVLVGPDRARAATFAAAVLAPIGVAVGGWYAWVSTFVANPSPTVLLRFDRAQVSELLPELPVMYPVRGPLHYVADRLYGIGVAWSPTGMSYWESFYVLHWVAPVALLAALGALWRTWPGLGASAADRARALLDHLGLRGPDAVFVVTLAAFAFGGWLSVQLVHKQFSSPWYFDQREGLVAWFFFVLPALWALRRGGVAGVVTLLLVLVSLGFGARAVWREAQFHEARAGLDQHGRLAKELAERDAASPGPLVVALEEGHAQRTAWRTPDIGYHWLSTRSTYATVGTMVHELGTDLVIWDRPRDSWGFLRNGGHLEADYAQLTGLPSPFKGVEPRAEALAPAPPRRVVVVAAPSIGKASLGRTYARFAFGSLAATPWHLLAAGQAEGPTVADAARARGRVVGEYRWALGPKPEADAAEAAAAGWAERPHDLTLVRFGERDAASLPAFLESIDEATMVLLVEAGETPERQNLWVRGPDVKAGKRPRSIEAADVAPTVAWLLGVPVAQNLPGRVLSEALAWDAAGALGRTDVASW